MPVKYPPNRAKIAMMGKMQTGTQIRLGLATMRVDEKDLHPVDWRKHKISPPF